MKQAAEQRFQVRTLRKGGRLYRQGDTLAHTDRDHIFRVLSGTIALAIPYPEHKGVYAGVVTPGGLFGIESIIQTPRMHDAVALASGTEIIRIPVDEEQKGFLLAQEYARNHLLAMLYACPTVTHRYRVLRTADPVLIERLTITQLARLLACSREMLSRIANHTNNT